MRPITAADLMNPEVLTVREDWTVEQLADFLIGHEISGAPVEAEDGRLVGVVSLRDIVAFAEEDAEDGSDDAEEADGDGPQENAETAPGDTPAAAPAPADAAGSDFFSRGWEDEEWSEEDLEDLELGDDDLLVEDIMTPQVFSVSPDTTVSEIASLMLKEHLHRLLVIEDGKPRGIISTSDLLGLLVDAE
jgi:CBS domain-containing protein